MMTTEKIVLVFSTLVSSGAACPATCVAGQYCAAPAVACSTCAAGKYAAKYHTAVHVIQRAASCGSFFGPLRKSAVRKEASRKCTDTGKLERGELGRVGCVCLSHCAG